MADLKESDKNSNGWMAVPAFGEWDMKNGVPDYSMDFSKIREMRKQNKNHPSRASLGNDDDLLATNKLRPNHHHHNKEEEEEEEEEEPRRRRRRRFHHQQPDDDDHHHGGSSPTGRKKLMGYFQCCIGA